MTSIGFIIGVVLIFLANAIAVMINVWLFRSMRTEFRKLNDPNYIKSMLEAKTQHGVPITPKFIKKMTISTFIGSIVTVAISLYILIMMGPNQMWSVFLGMGILLAYVGHGWFNYTETKKNIVVNDSTIKTSTKWAKIGAWIIIPVIIAGTLFKEWMMSSPVFQIWFLGMAISIVIASEISIRKISKR